MAEENETAQEEGKEPSFQLVRCFLKDASLEMPHAPDIFLEEHQEQPGVNFRFDVGTRVMPVQDHYEVLLRVTVTVGFKEKAMFLVECNQCGIFEIKNVPAESLQHITNVVSPSLMLPYVRANVADLINRTGLPTVQLPEVNFEGLYAQKMQEMMAKAEKKEETATA